MNGKRYLPFFFVVSLDLVFHQQGSSLAGTVHLGGFAKPKHYHKSTSENIFALLIIFLVAQRSSRSARKHAGAYLGGPIENRTYVRLSLVPGAGLSTTVAGTFRARRLVIEKSFELCRDTSSCLPLGGQTKSAPCGAILSLSPQQGSNLRPLA